MRNIFSKVANFFKNEKSDLSDKAISFADIVKLADMQDKEQFFAVIGSCSLRPSIFMGEEDLKGDAAKVLNYVSKTVDVLKKSKTVSVAAFKESVLNFGDEPLDGWAESAQFIIPAEDNIFKHYVNNEENEMVMGGFCFKKHKFAFIQFQTDKEGRRNSNQAYISPYVIDYDKKKASGINVRMINACDALSEIRKFNSEIRVVVFD